MSNIIVSKDIVKSPYKTDVFVCMEKVFICAECKRVVVDPVGNIGWSGDAPYTCIIRRGGCNGSNSMIPISKYFEKLQKFSDVQTESCWICHPDFFSVTADGRCVFLESDLCREGRISLVDHINNKKSTDDDDAHLIQQLKKKSRKELSILFSKLFDE